MSETLKTTMLKIDDELIQIKKYSFKDDRFIINELIIEDFVSDNVKQWRIILEEKIIRKDLELWFFEDEKCVGKNIFKNCFPKKIENKDIFLVDNKISILCCCYEKKEIPTLS